uniref:Uncharacterized protein n=1 Tax=Anguilla anguilla TaxID=7936 RepID=A0A0E9TQ62_ANGAN
MVTWEKKEKSNRPVHEPGLAVTSFVPFYK